MAARSRIQNPARLGALLAGGLCALLAAPAAAQNGPTLVTYLQQTGMDCMVPQGDEGPEFPTPAFIVGQSQMFDLCATIEPPVSAGEEIICEDAQSSHLCAVRATFRSTTVPESGMSVNTVLITDFVPADGFVSNPDVFTTPVSELQVFGGDPVNGTFRFERLGKITVMAQRDGADLCRTSASYVNAAGETVVVMEGADLGQTETTCGDNVLEPPGEECDDGNTVGGDGCSSMCRIEEGIALQGALPAGVPGTFSFELGGTPFTINLPAGTTAAQAIQQAVSQVNMTFPGTAVQALSPCQIQNPTFERCDNVFGIASMSSVAEPSIVGGGADPMGELLATTMEVTAFPQVDPDSELDVIPEPGRLTLLGAGLAFLALLGWLRARRPAGDSPA